MTEANAVISFKQGVELLKGGYPRKALTELRRCVELDGSNPYYLSFLGLAIARSKRGSAESALSSAKPRVELLREKELQLHLNLADDVYMTSGRREKRDSRHWTGPRKALDPTLA